MKLSIITINYNNREGLQRTINSVICQTWRDFEWIIIDGGSTDGSKELIEKYQEHFAYWCSEPDKGVYNAMNKGIARAKGEYCLFLNSGDVFHNKCVLTDVFLEKDEADIISGLTIRTDNGKILIGHEDDLVVQLFEISLNHQGTFIKRIIFETITYDEQYKIVSDWKFWWDALVFGNFSLKRINIIIADVEIGGLSSNPKYFKLQREEREEVLNSFFPKRVLKTFNDYNELKRECSEIQLNQFQFLYHNLIYLYNNHIHIFILLRKIISFLYKLCKMF